MFLLLLPILTVVFAAVDPVRAASRGGEAAPDRAPGQIFCMTFNIRYGTAPDGENHWMLRNGLAMEVIRRNAPGLLCLQEALAWQIDLVRDSIPGFGAIGVGRDNGLDTGEHCAILFDAKRFIVAESGTFWFSDTPEVPGSKSWGNNVTRICTWARLVDREADAAFYIYNVHLDHESQNARERSARLLAERIAHRTFADPVIVAGDFNAGEENAALQLLTGKKTLPAGRDFPLVDSFRLLHPDAEAVGTYHAFKGERTGEKIDFILVSREWHVLESSIEHFSRGGKFPSDHFPVTALLSP